MHSTALTTAVFEERQSFIRSWWWIFPLIGGLLAVELVAGVRSTKWTAAWIPLGVLLLVGGLLAWLRLDTRLDATGITYRMRPLRQQHLAWGEVRRAYVRQYSPIGEYGGWGIRGLFRQSRALNVAGNQGLQLELADGRRLLLGTQQPEELRQVLAQLGMAVG